MQRINVPLTSEEAQALISLAKQNIRHPREQARFMLRRELENRGLLPPEPRPVESISSGNVKSGGG